MTSQNDIEELTGSELGTKQYWETSYSREIQNYKSYGDVGEIWFDEDSQTRVINYIRKDESIQTSFGIIDLGCGNGMFLIELAREGYKKLVGVDYSAKAVELASNIAIDQNLKIEYSVADLLDEESCKKLGKFHIVHDKGTYDAVSLNPDNPKDKREKYIENVRNLLTDDGIFLITSCNWTEDELTKSFVGKFEKYDVIPTPQFKFGGGVGSVITSLVFKKEKID